MTTSPTGILLTVIAQAPGKPPVTVVRYIPEQEAMREFVAEKMAADVAREAIRKISGAALLLACLLGCSSAPQGEPQLDARLGAACRRHWDCEIPGWQWCEQGRCTMPCLREYHDLEGARIEDYSEQCWGLGGYCDKRDLCQAE